MQVTFNLILVNPTDFHTLNIFSLFFNLQILIMAHLQASLITLWIFVVHLNALALLTTAF